MAIGTSFLDFPPRRKIALQPRLDKKMDTFSITVNFLKTSNAREINVKKVPDAYNRLAPICFHVINMTPKHVT